MSLVKFSVIPSYFNKTHKNSPHLLVIPFICGHETLKPIKDPFIDVLRQWGDHRVSIFDIHLRTFNGGIKIDVFKWPGSFPTISFLCCLFFRLLISIVVIRGELPHKEEVLQDAPRKEYLSLPTRHIFFIKKKHF
jgi:hypothetical protein